MGKFLEPKTRLVAQSLHLAIFTRIRCPMTYGKRSIRDARHIPKLWTKLSRLKLAEFGELNAEGKSHAQDQLLRRCCCVGSDWRWNMDWRRDRDFDQRACCFDYRSIRDDGECKGSAYFALC